MTRSHARAALSLVRPGMLPGEAPRGTRAREIAADGYVDHPGYGLTPDRVVSIFRLAEQGWTQPQCDLFDDLRENDAKLRNLLEGRAQAVWGKEWSIVPDGGERDSALAAEVLDESLRSLPFVDALAHQLEFNPVGWGASEIDWNVVERGGRSWVVPTWIANVPPRRFRVWAPTDELRLLTGAFRSDGEPLELGKWWVTRRSGARLARAGLMRTAAWYALWKRYGTRDWVVYAEKFGIPLALVKYDPTIEDNGKDVALEIVENIGNDGGAAVPKGIDVEVVEADRNGNAGGTHGGLIEFCNEEMSCLINSSTLATGEGGGKEGGGSYAQARVHASIRWEAVQSDAERVQDSFRRCIAAPFMRFNSLAARPPLLEVHVVRDQAPSDLLSAAVLLKQQLGIDVSISQLRRVIGLRGPLGAGDSAPGPIVPGGAAPPAPKGEP